MIRMKASTRARERLNITLPTATVKLLDRMTKTGNRSRFIDRAIREFAQRKFVPSGSAKISDRLERRDSREQLLFRGRAIGQRRVGLGDTHDLRCHGVASGVASV